MSSLSDIISLFSRDHLHMTELFFFLSFSQNIFVLSRLNCQKFFFSIFSTHLHFHKKNWSVFDSWSVFMINWMATDIEFSSCSSSLLDSGFESAPPKPPPRKKRSKSTWSLVEKEPDCFESYTNADRKSSTNAFSDFFAPFKNFAPSAKEKLKQSFWSLVILFGKMSLMNERSLIFSTSFHFVDDDSDESTALRGGMVSRSFTARRSCAFTQTRRWFSSARDNEKRRESNCFECFLEWPQALHRPDYSWGDAFWFFSLMWNIFNILFLLIAAGSSSFWRAKLPKYSRTYSTSISIRNARHKSKWSDLEETSIKRKVGAE